MDISENVNETRPRRGDSRCDRNWTGVEPSVDDDVFSLESLSRSPWSTRNDRATSTRRKLSRAQRYDSFRINFLDKWNTSFTQSLRNSGCGSTANSSELRACGRRHLGCHNFLHSVQNKRICIVEKFQWNTRVRPVSYLLYVRQHFTILAQGRFFRCLHPSHLTVSLPSVFDGARTPWLQTVRASIFTAGNISVRTNVFCITI